MTKYYPFDVPLDSDLHKEAAARVRELRTKEILNSELHRKKPLAVSLA